MGTVTLIISGLRALSLLAPALTREGHGERIAKVIDSIATLAERGAEGVEELKALVNKLETMQGVDRQEVENLWTSIESTHNAIQEAAKRIPADPPPPDPLPPDTSETGGAGSQGAGDDAGGEDDSGDAGGSGADNQQP